MSGVKKLASQTFFYGFSSMAARLLSYLLTPLLTYAANISKEDFGKQSLLYSALPVLSILFTYGFETAYFRFSSKAEHKNSIYSTSFFSILISTIVFTAILWYFKDGISALAGFEQVPQIAMMTIFIIAIDTLNVIPFAKLRQDERPIRFVVIRISSICVMFFLTWFWIYFCPSQLAKNSSSWVAFVYEAHQNPIVYLVAANLAMALFTSLLLWKEFGQIRWQFNTRLWKEMMIFSLPLIIVGLGGMVNETFDRIMLKAWLPGNELFQNEQVGIYNACYKLSLLITMFIQAFRMGAEPFFFKQASGQDPKAVYARVMKFFVLVICLLFLSVSLFLPFWSLLIGPAYRSAIGIVPILLMANIFLGIYYNLSIWFKLSNRTLSGTYITLIGTAITLLINYLLIPKFGLFASAWATFFCYGTMMVISYYWGQQVYPVPYAIKKLGAYLFLAVGIFGLHKGLLILVPNPFFSFATGLLLLMSYGVFVVLKERNEFERLPFIGKYIQLWPKT